MRNYELQYVFCPYCKTMHGCNYYPDEGYYICEEVRKSFTKADSVGASH